MDARGSGAGTEIIIDENSGVFAAILDDKKRIGDLRLFKRASLPSPLAQRLSLTD